MKTAKRTKTPWGDAETLRERRLSPGSGAAAEEVAQSQRERLMAAMVAVCPERGYEATTVAELLALSGVSRGDFYRHFADKQACYLATIEEILERAMRYVALRYDGQGTALRAFTRLIVEQPAAARLCFVECYAAGPEALAAMDGAVATVEALYERSFRARGEGPEMPGELVGAIVGGLRKVIYTRLRNGREEELAGLAGELWDWSFSYRAPPAPLLRRRVEVGSGAGIYQPRDAGERLIRATVAAVAANGQATKIDEIVARAGVSLSTFYENFEGKEEVIAAAIDAGEARLFALCHPAYRRARSWPEAVRAAFEAMFAFLAAEPELARLAMVEIYAAGGAQALDRRDRTIAGLQRFLEPGMELSAGCSALVPEAIGGATYALVYEQIRRHGPQSLPRVAPMASYLALAPFLGAEQACAVAGGGRGR